LKPAETVFECVLVSRWSYHSCRWPVILCWWCKMGYFVIVYV